VSATSKPIATMLEIFIVAPASAFDFQK